MSASVTVPQKKNRTVTDSFGQTYELTGKLGEGGQGTVCTTNHPNVLVKVARKASKEKLINWVGKIERLMRSPLTGLPIAKPLARIVSPQPGYVMELMDGLVQLSVLMQESADALSEDSGLQVYIQNGGLLRRLRILARLSRVLAELHSRGLTYGDLSPTNVFVSKSLEYAEVWLIDSDNIDSQSRDSAQGVFTPDYGAPEILRGESGINTLTDSWSFAVLAYNLLIMAHPLKGDIVLEGEPEMEDAALRGALPWVDHPTDQSNELTLSGLPRTLVLNTAISELFERCFNLGLVDSAERPSLSEWAEGFEASVARILQCAECNSSYFYKSKSKLVCPFCDFVNNPNSMLLLQEYFYLPPELLREKVGDVPEDLILKNCWVRTGGWQVLTEATIQLKSLLPGDSLYLDDKSLCSMTLDRDGLRIVPSLGSFVSIQKDKGAEVKAITSPLQFKTQHRAGVSYWLHLGVALEAHYVWQFTW